MIIRNSFDIDQQNCQSLEKLAKFITIVGEDEIKVTLIEKFIEKEKEKLWDIYEFNATNLFNLIDKRNLGQLDIIDLHQLLSDQGYKIHYQEAEIIFHRIKTKVQSHLTLKNFSQFLYPQLNLRLRNEISSKKIEMAHQNPIMSPHKSIFNNEIIAFNEQTKSFSNYSLNQKNIIEQFSKILFQIIANHVIETNYKLELQDDPEFDFDHCFSLIDIKGYNALNFQQLHEFTSKYSTTNFDLQQTIQLFFNRLQRKSEIFLTKNEIQQFIYDISYEEYQEIRKDRILQNEIQRMSPLLTDEQQYEEIEQIKQQENNLALLFQEAIMLQQKIEETKQALIFQKDFCILDVYNAFKSQNLFSLKAFLESLNYFGIFPQQDQSCRLFQVLDKDQDGFISYNDFQSLFITNNVHLNSNLLSRQQIFAQNQNQKASMEQLKNYWSYETLKLFKEVIIKQIDLQELLEQIKQEFIQNNMNQVQLYIYRKWQQQDFYEFEEFLQRNGVWTNSQQVQSFYQKFQQQQ